MNHPQDSPEDEYLVLHQEQQQGPFNVDFIEAMVLAGVYPPSVKVQKAGTSSWIPFSQVTTTSRTATAKSLPPRRDGASASDTSSKPVVPPPDPTSEIPSPPARSKFTPTEVVVGKLMAVFSVLALLWIIAVVAPTNKPPSGHAVPPTTSTPRTSSHKPAAPPIAPPPQAIPAYTAPKIVIPPDENKIYRDATGHSYRVSNSDHYRLLIMKTALGVKDSKIERSKQERESLHRKIESERTYLDKRSSYAVDAFNANVHRLNEMNASIEILIDDYNRDVESFNTDLQRVGTLIY